MTAGQQEDQNFESARFVPVARLLGPHTLQAVTNPRDVSGLILKKPKERGSGRPIESFTPLTERRPLLDSQASTLRDVILDPESYWNGWPIWRRLPPIPGFAFEIRGDEATAHLLVDLQNPGWEFLCEGERYWGFNFAEHSLRNLAKDLFPEYASPHRSSTWRRGAIKELECEAAR